MNWELDYIPMKEGSRTETSEVIDNCQTSDPARKSYQNIDYTFVPAPLPTFQRWLDLKSRFGGMSTLRALEYEHLCQIEFSGKMLDVGGGRNAAYLKYIDNVDYHSVNIDPNIDPTWLVDVGEKLPVENHSFDVCLSLNTLEHVYDPLFLLREMHRVLRPSGTAYIAVPWMFQIHGHPDDFLRATPSWWKTATAEAGFSKIELTPLVWGRGSTRYSVSGKRGLFSQLAHFSDIMYASLMFRDKCYAGKRGQRISNVALGHFMKVVK